MAKKPESDEVPAAPAPAPGKRTEVHPTQPGTGSHFVRDQAGRLIYEGTTPMTPKGG